MAARGAPRHAGPGGRRGGASSTSGLSTWLGPCATIFSYLGDDIMLATRDGERIRGVIAVGDHIGQAVKPLAQLLRDWAQGRMNRGGAAQFRDVDGGRQAEVR